MILLLGMSSHCSTVLRKDILHNFVEKEEKENKEMRDLVRGREREKEREREREREKLNMEL